MTLTLGPDEGFIREVLDRTPYGMAVHQDGHVVFANRAAATMLAYDAAEDLRGQPITKIVHPSGWEVARQRIQRMLSGETGLYPCMDTYLKRDGTAIPVEVFATPFVYDGRLAVQVTARDISGRHRAGPCTRARRASVR